MTLQFSNDVVNDVEPIQKSKNYASIACLKSEPACKLINRIPVLRLLISSILIVLFAFCLLVGYHLC